MRARTDGALTSILFVGGHVTMASAPPIVDAYAVPAYGGPEPPMGYAVPEQDMPVAQAVPMPHAVPMALPYAVVPQVVVQPYAVVPSVAVRRGRVQVRAPRRNQGWLGLMGAAFVVGASAAISIGFGFYSDASQCHPATDFLALGDVCPVTHIEHTSETKQSGSSGDTTCYDSYVYQFAAPWPASPENYTSREEEVKRYSHKCRKGDRASPGTFEKGGKYACWAPAANKTKTSLPKSYNCGNVACVKLFDPADEVKAIKWLGIGLMAGGGGGIMFSLVFFGCWRSSVRRRYRGDAALAASLLATGGVA